MKTWTVGEQLLASDLNANFNELDEWRYYGKVSFASESLKTFSSLPAHDYYKLVFNLKNTGTTLTTRLAVGLRLNSITTGYNDIYFTSSGVGLNNTLGFWSIFRNIINGYDVGVGEVIISGKHANGEKSIAMSVGSSLSGQHTGLRGGLTGNSADVSQIDIAHIDGFSAWNVEAVLIGTVELWFKDNHA